MDFSNSCFALLIPAALAGCAAAVPGFVPPDTKPKYEALVKTQSGSTDNDGRYVLSPHEQQLNCKKLSGIIVVGILQLRESGERHRPTLAAKAAQGALSPVIGGSSYGMSPDADHARALARAEALNARLAEKGCPTFDLKAELAPGNTGTPAPVKVEKRR